MTDSYRHTRSERKRRASSSYADRDRQRDRSGDWRDRSRERRERSRDRRDRSRDRRDRSRDRRDRSRERRDWEEYDARRRKEQQRDWEEYDARRSREQQRDRGLEYNREHACELPPRGRDAWAPADRGHSTLLRPRSKSGLRSDGSSWWHGSSYSAQMPVEKTVTSSDIDFKRRGPLRSGAIPMNAKEAAWQTQEVEKKRLRDLEASKNDCAIKVEHGIVATKALEIQTGLF